MFFAFASTHYLIIMFTKKSMKCDTDQYPTEIHHIALCVIIHSSVINHYKHISLYVYIVIILPLCWNFKQQNTARFCLSAHFGSHAFWSDKQNVRIHETPYYAYDAKSTKHETTG